MYVTSFLFFNMKLAYLKYNYYQGIKKKKKIGNFNKIFKKKIDAN